jgi:hypothetical protein
MARPQIPDDLSDLQPRNSPTTCRAAPARAALEDSIPRRKRPRPALPWPLPPPTVVAAPGRQMVEGGGGGDVLQPCFRAVKRRRQGVWGAVKRRRQGVWGAVKRRWQGAWGAELGGAAGVLQRRRPSAVHHGQGGAWARSGGSLAMRSGAGALPVRCRSCSRTYWVEEVGPAMPDTSKTYLLSRTLLLLFLL